ncbi:Transporter of the ATP-binding cassette (ABC), partial [Spiromyces aspiralis]
GYVSQRPWLRNATIRENILCGQPLDIERYKRVLYCCALVPDLESFPNSDLSLVGEGGIILSGGQRQRVAIARALYGPAPVLLFDDCLSAVDVQTGQHLLRYCIDPRSPVIRGRTMVLVTNHLSMTLRFASKVVMMSDGRISAQGSPRELVEQHKLSIDEPLPEGNDWAKTLELVPEDSDLFPAKLDFFIEADPISEPQAADVVESIENAKDSINLADAKNLKWMVEILGGARIWLATVGMTLLDTNIRSLKSYIQATTHARPSELGTRGPRNYLLVSTGLSLLSSSVDELFRDIRLRIGSASSLRVETFVRQRIINAKPVYFDNTPSHVVYSLFDHQPGMVIRDLVFFLTEAMSTAIETLTILAFLIYNAPLTVYVVAAFFVYWYRVRSVYSVAKDRVKKTVSRHAVYFNIWKGDLSVGGTTIRAMRKWVVWIREVETRKEWGARLQYAASAANTWEHRMYTLVEPVISVCLVSAFVLSSLTRAIGFSTVVDIIMSHDGPQPLSPPSLLSEAPGGQPLLMISTGIMGLLISKTLHLMQLFRDASEINDEFKSVGNKIKVVLNLRNLPQ